MEQDRFDLPCAVPALVQWAACCQGRASDPALAAEWEQQAPRLLEAGVGAGPVEATMARESLLWKSWNDQPAIVPAPKGAVMSSKPNGTEVQQCWLANLALAPGKGYALPARSDTITEILPAQATLEDATTLTSDPWCVGLIEHASWVGNLFFPVADKTAGSRVQRVSGRLRITQASAWDAVVLPLKVQASAELHGVGQVAIVAFKHDIACGFHVVCARPKGGIDTTLRERMAEYHRRGQWMPDALIQKRWDDPGNLESYWLVDGQGQRIHPKQLENWGRPAGEWILCFPASVQTSATSLVVCHRTAPSSRIFDFAFTREELKQAARR